MISKNLLKQRFCSASSTYNKHAVIQSKMAVELVEIANCILPLKSKNILELGCGTGLLTTEILKIFSPANYYINDIVPDIQEYITPITTHYKNTDFNYIFGDIEYLNFPDNQNIIWSGATIQWVQDLETFFMKMNRLLTNNGYLALSTFGPDNYKEIKSITTQGIEYLSMPELLKKAMPWFEVIKAKETTEELLFNSPVEVLKHMRLTGVNAISESSWTKRDLNKFCKSYENFMQNNKYILTYNPYYIVLKKKETF